MWFFVAPAFRPEVICQLEPPSVYLKAASAVFVTAMAAESAPTTLPLVAMTSVTVLVGFGGGQMAIWRLPAMVGVVEVSIFGVKMARIEPEKNYSLHKW